jgi:hypothetical protein
MLGMSRAGPSPWELERIEPGLLDRPSVDALFSSAWGGAGRSPLELSDSIMHNNLSGQAPVHRRHLGVTAKNAAGAVEEWADSILSAWAIPAAVTTQELDHRERFA